MTLPSVRAVGTPAAGTGNITPGNPTHQADDILLLFVENAEGSGVAAPTGWAHVPGSPQTQGTNVTASNIMWKRATSSAETNPTVSDPGNHQIGVVVSFKGVVKTGNPWDFTPVGNSGNGATASATGSTTTVAECLVVVGLAGGVDTLVDQFSGQANGSLGSLTARVQDWTDLGNGGGIGVYTGTRTVAGATGTTTVDLATSGAWAALTLALRPLEPFVLGQAVDTDSAPPLAFTKGPLSFTQALETDTAPALAPAKTSTLGQASDSHTAQPVTTAADNPPVTFDLGQATETDTAQALVRTKTITLGLATETDTAQPLSSSKSKGVGQATETSTANPVTPSKTSTPSQTLETDVAHPLTPTKGPKSLNGAATDAHTAFSVSATKRITLGLATETDTAQPIDTSSEPVTGSIDLGFTQDIAVAWPLTATKGPKTLGQATAETDVAHPLVGYKTFTLGLAVELDTVPALELTKDLALGLAADADAAFPVSVGVAAPAVRRARATIRPPAAAGATMGDTERRATIRHTTGQAR